MHIRRLLPAIVCVALLCGACATTGNRQVTKWSQGSLTQSRLPKFDVPIVVNDRVMAWVDYFQGTGHRHYARYLSRSGRYIPKMQEILKKYALPQDLVYVAMIESGFSSKAHSRARAVGQWQFIKGTGKRYGLEIGQWVDERRDPEKATIAAANAMFSNFAGVK